MNLSTDSSVAELRHELERARKKAQDLQMNTTDPDEWAVLNTLRWELEDLDKDIYLGQFIKNNDKIAKLVGEIEGATAEAEKLVNTLAEMEQAVKEARTQIKSTSKMAGELAGFFDEVEETLDVIKA